MSIYQKYRQYAQIGWDKPFSANEYANWQLACKLINWKRTPVVHLP